MPSDHRKAAEWFLKAADQGDAGAARILADLYSNGDGVEKRPDEAYLWASVAADLGHPGGEALRSELASALSPADLNAALTRLNRWREQQDRRLEAAAPQVQAGSKEHLEQALKSTLKPHSQPPIKASPQAKTKTHPGKKPQTKAEATTKKKTKKR
ncbi:MAG: sel1 repeat family protein [Gammaproteobacteria bacterium]|nr:sel1 repeat family protein [Gammaproteobacteria bacterium]NDE56004.1 sel1 repeat family protein [Gammaproteobacteria bacterium]